MFDDYLLLRIKGHLLSNLSGYNYYQIRLTMVALSLVSWRYNRIFRPKRDLLDYFGQRLVLISFWPCCEHDALTSQVELVPIRHDGKMVDYVLHWRNCKDCLSQIVEYFIQEGLDLGEGRVFHLSSDQILSGARRLLCDYHFTDLNDRNKISKWGQIRFQVDQTAMESFQAKITIIVKSPHLWRWC